MTSADRPGQSEQVGYVPRDLCRQIQLEQREAGRRTWEELRTLRRLIIGVVLGGQLLAGGVNLAGLAWWFDRHESHTHPVTAGAIERVRAEAWAERRELRREMLEALHAAGENPSARRPDPETEENAHAM